MAFHTATGSRVRFTDQLGQRFELAVYTMAEWDRLPRDGDGPEAHVTDDGRYVITATDVPGACPSPIPPSRGESG